MTNKVWPSGCVCQAVRAPGSKVTSAPATRAGSGGLNSGSIRTVPVNQSPGPLPEGADPARLISIARFLLFRLAVIPVQQLHAIPVQHAAVLRHVVVEGFQVADAVRLAGD